MKEAAQPLKRFLLQLLLLLGLYSISRLVFTLMNLEFFGGVTLPAYLHMAWAGLRFDIATIIITNVPYILLLFLPFPLFKMKWWTRLMHWLFVVLNSFAFAFEISDWAYYPFTLKRATSDVLDMLMRTGDFALQVPHFLTDYWYIFVAAIAFIFLIAKLDTLIRKVAPITGFGWHWQQYLLRTVQLILVMGASVIGARGGFQLIPLNMGNAMQAEGGKYAPIVLNTPYSIISTYAGERLPELDFYSSKEIVQYVNPVKQPSGKPFQPKNVVVIILESFSKQFTGLSKFQSYTPFLDSLMQHSYVCTNAYANALHSAEGIPAIIAGLPALMSEPFTTSYYGTNGITAIPELLRKKGYNTSFYHGGTNGTMSFDIFAANAGYDNYYGRKEYHNEKDYDGNWGIWDEPFLQYFATGLAKTKQPFFSTVFTLTSHDPFRVPQEYRSTLPKGPLKIQQCIAYTDMALRKFFERASKDPYFKNTLFVISPDHCSLLTQDDNDHNNMGFYRIPLIFFAPGDSNMHGMHNQLVEQIDILPTIMDYVGYDKPYYALGNSIFDNKQPRFVVNELNKSYQCVMDDYILKSEGFDFTSIYHYTSDTNCTNNLKDNPEGKAIAQKMQPYLKAFLQTYNHGMIHNAMEVKQ
ncbi:MAG: hypothetical protein EOP51_05630 [Sphingobacteriales bacterium]|nr:MAG: hypothetical protein EOP51_05630 [Sphingobacteriales bacterium]